MSLQDILAQTVQEALSEREDTIIEGGAAAPRFVLRRKMRDTEQLYDDAEEEEDEKEEFEEPEPGSLSRREQKTLSDYRARFRARREGTPWGRCYHALLCVMAVLEHFPSCRAYTR